MSHVAMMSQSAIQQQERLQQANLASQLPTSVGGADDRNRQLLVPPEYAPVDGTLELLKLMLDSAHTDRHAKKTQELGADRAADAAEKSQITHLRDKANAERKAGLILGLAQIGSGAITASAGGVGFASAGSKVAEVEKRVTAMNEGAKGTSAITEGAGQVAASMVKGQAAQDEIAAKEDESRASTLRRSAESLRSDIGDLKQHAGKIFDLVRDIEAAQERCTQIALQTR